MKKGGKTYRSETVKRQNIFFNSKRVDAQNEIEISCNLKEVC